MATSTLFSLFDEVEVFRPAPGRHMTTDTSTVYTAPEDGQVQIRYDARALRVWLLDGADEYVLELTVRNPRITELAEDRVTIEGFEQTNGALGVNAGEVTVFLSASRLRPTV